jgi:hypothetical protein
MPPRLRSLARDVSAAAWRDKRLEVLQKPTLVQGEQSTIYPEAKRAFLLKACSVEYFLEGLITLLLKSSLKSLHRKRSQ